MQLASEANSDRKIFAHLAFTPAIDRLGRGVAIEKKFGLLKAPTNPVTFHEVS